MLATLLALVPVLAGLLLSGCPAPAPTGPPEVAPPLVVRVLGINDLHGHLEGPTGRKTIGGREVHLGGAAALAARVRAERAGAAHSIFVAAGDLIGASPLVSSWAQDEPTVQVLDAMGLELSALGNHELDEGADELLRLQNGGCADEDCARGPFPGARFRWLAANVQRGGALLLPPSQVREFDGVKLGFVGIVTQDTPQMVVAGSAAGLFFEDELVAANREAERLLGQGVRALVLLMHEGGSQRGADPDGCDGPSADLRAFAEGLHPAYAAVLTGHSHRWYRCLQWGRPITQAGHSGQALTRLDLLFDRATGEVTGVQAANLPIEAGPGDPDIAALVAGHVAAVQAIASEPVGQLDRPATRQRDGGGSDLGRLVADAMLWATRGAGAQVAITNAGGLRADLGEGGLALTYADAQRALPFSNQLITMTLSGAQLLSLLAREHEGGRQGSLMVSRGLSYRYDAGGLIAGSVTLDGRPLDAATPIRLTTNSFLAGGRDSARELGEGTERVVGGEDLASFVDYLALQPTTRVPTDRRVNGP